MTTSLVFSLLALLLGWQAGTVITPDELSASAEDEWFVATEIDDGIFDRIQGNSYKADCTLPREDLRYLRVIHHDGHGSVVRGEMVCHRDIAPDLLDIFRELFRQGYPIERMRLIDDYGSDDIASMEDNNSSCFNFRKIAGSEKLSAHSMGKAVDINPRYNPYVKRRNDGSIVVSPESGRKYMARDSSSVYIVRDDDIVCRLFKKHGFIWGGDWKSVKDFQHFEKL